MGKVVGSHKLMLSRPFDKGSWLGGLGLVAKEDHRERVEITITGRG